MSIKNPLVACPHCGALLTSNLLPRHEPICVGDPPTLERLYISGNVIKKDGCHEWGRKQNGGGYGILSDMAARQTGHRKAHRLAADLFGLPVTDKILVLHRCDNPSCIRPEHLFLGTQADNIADMRDKGRHTDPPRRTKPVEVLACPTCSKPFKRIIGNKYPLTCSNECGKILRGLNRRGQTSTLRKHVKRVCSVCGKEDSVQPSYAIKHPTCSTGCGHVYAWRTRKNGEQP